MRFIQILLMAMLVIAPLAETSFARGQNEGRSVAAEKSKKAGGKKAAKGKKAKAKKSAKAKNGAKAKKKAVKKSAKSKAKKSKKASARKEKKVARVKKVKSHAPAEMFPEDAADPAPNFEISPEMQDDLPEPNTGNLTD